jgi:hypothetical protein
MKLGSNALAYKTDSGPIAERFMTRNVDAGATTWSIACKPHTQPSLNLRPVTLPSGADQRPRIVLQTKVNLSVAAPFQSLHLLNGAHPRPLHGG